MQHVIRKALKYCKMEMMIWTREENVSLTTSVQREFIEEMSDFTIQLLKMCIPQTLLTKWKSK